MKEERVKMEKKYEKAWLSYRRSRNAENTGHFGSVFTNGTGVVAETAVSELQGAVKELLGCHMERGSWEEASVRLILEPDCGLGEEGYEIRESAGRLTVASEGERGLLYGIFACIRLLQVEKPLEELSVRKIPSAPLRMLNHWDNMDGSIERGYSGDSFFFREDKVLVDDRTRAYARLASSVGINAVVINNVNVKGSATRLIEDDYSRELEAMSEIFAGYGIALYLSINFAAPMELGGHESADPCDPQVQQWWKEKAADLYRRLPGFGGFLVKADSEGRPGPFTYGRTHAEGANMLADAVAPYGGRIIWRCFVYNCQQDWRERKIDRAKSGYDYFMPLDGKFRDNVILQIKNGPMDFQVREPVSPLFGGLEHTNSMLEVQIAQEYTGQQRHVCYLLPMFKQVLEFKTCCREDHDRVRDIVTGRTFGQTNCGIVAVANTGDDENWTGHDLAAANLFGFGRLSFDMDLSVEEIAEEWIACTFGNDPEIMEKISKILMMSWPAYEKYTSPLGIGWMVNPGYHYGPNVDGYEYDRWGTYHRADHKGIGVDRSPAGTGYSEQYRRLNADMYGKRESCPEELLLFFHHIPYDYRLSTGKTLIQHIYDTHFEGALEAKEMLDIWNSLESKVPMTVFERVQKRMEHQASHAEEWRDQVNTYFYRKSMIPDEQGRTIY